MPHSSTRYDRCHVSEHVQRCLDHRQQFLRDTFCSDVRLSLTRKGPKKQERIQISHRPSRYTCSCSLSFLDSLTRVSTQFLFEHPVNTIHYICCHSLFLGWTSPSLFLSFYPHFSLVDSPWLPQLWPTPYPLISSPHTLAPVPCLPLHPSRPIPDHSRRRVRP